MEDHTNTVDPLSYYEGKVNNVLSPEPQLYRTVDSDEMPLPNYLIMKTGKYPTHQYRLGHNHGDSFCHFMDDVNELLKIHPFKLVMSVQTFDSDEKVIVNRNLYEYEDESGCLLFICSGIPTAIKKGKNNHKAKIHLGVMSNINPDIYNNFVLALIERYKKPKVESNNVHLVIQSSHGYDTEQFNLPKQKIDIEMNYGSEFIPIHKKILDTLNKKDSKGLVLLHGDPGTGKTHYLKYLASKIKDKKVLFIPPYLADFITSPEMTPFLIDNSNSVLFIEDAERVITDRNDNGGSGVSNILNITDGILSDILKIQIVATFNMDRKKIDPALLRKGRLIAEHKFGELSVDDSNKALKHLGIDFVTDKPMTLTEIYNHKETHYVSDENKGRPKIGFGFR